MASNIGGMQEIVENGVNGLLFEPGNTDDLGGKLRAFLSLPDGRVSEMGRAGRLKVERHFSAERHYEKLMSAYARIRGCEP